MGNKHSIVIAILIATFLPLVIAGCGGGGGGAGTTAIAAYGEVQLPPGYKGTLSSLKILTGSGTATISANGSFVAQLPGGGPGYAQVVDANDNPVMSGFIDPANSKALNAISSTSTAIALEFFDLGAFVLPQSQYSHTLTLIQSNTNIKTLASTVQARLVADPEALSDGDSQIASAVSTASLAIIPTMARSQLASTAQQAAELFEPPSSQGGQNSPPISITINPYDSADAGKSGVTLVQSSDGTGVVATNNLRRESKFYLFERYYINSSGTNIPKFQLINLNKDSKENSGSSALEVPETVALGGTPELLNDVFEKKVPWAPVTTATIPTPLDNSTAKKTEYIGVDVGPLPFWLTGKPAPVIWTDSLFESYQQPWETDIQSESVITFVRGILIPLVLSVCELTPSIPPSEATIEAEASAVSQEIQQVLPNVVSEIESGEMQKPIQDIVQEFATDQTFVEQIVEDLLPVAPGAPMVRPATANPIQGALVGALAAFSRSSKLLAVFNSFGRAVDMGAVIVDNLNASPVEGWIIDVVPPTVRLQPSSVSVAPGQTSQAMQVTTSVDQSTLGKATLAYVWTNTNQNGTFQDSLGNQGTTTITSIPTTAPYLVSVSYKANANASAGATDTITVKAYEKPDNSSSDPSSWIPIGSASSTVTISGSGTYTLSGLSGGNFNVVGSWGELSVTVNGTVVYADSGGVTGGPRSPISFQAQSGQTMNIQVRDFYPLFTEQCGISNLYLTTPAGKTTLLMPAQTYTAQATQITVVINQNFALP